MLIVNECLLNRKLVFPQDNDNFWEDAAAIFVKKNSISRFLYLCKCERFDAFYNKWNPKRELLTCVYIQEYLQKKGGKKSGEKQIRFFFWFHYFPLNFLILKK